MVDAWSRPSRVKHSGDPRRIREQLDAAEGKSEWSELEIAAPDIDDERMATDGKYALYVLKYGRAPE